MLATVSGAALADSAVYVNKADISVPDTDVANQTVSSIYPYGISSYNGFEASITNPTIAVTVTSSGNDPEDGALGTAYGVFNIPGKQNNDAEVTGALLTVGGDTSTVSFTTSANGVSRGIYAAGGLGSDVIVNGASLTLDATSAESVAHGIVALNNSTVTVNSDTINISANGATRARAIEASGSTGIGTVILGKDSSVTTLNATAKNGTAFGIFAGPKVGSTVTVNGKSLTINAHSDTDDAYGLFAQSSVTPDYEGNVSTININAEDTVINVTSDAGESHQYGIIAMSNSRVNVNGNLTVNAGSGDAILTRGGSVITINPDKDKTVQLTGNIEYNYNEANSGNIADSTVNLNLSDANSFWTGNAVLSNGGASDSSNDTVAGLNLNLSNGGTRNVANSATATTSESGASTTPLAINNLSLNDSTVNFTDASQAAKIENLSGTGGQVNTAVEKNADGTYKTSTLSADKVDTSSGTPTLNMNMVGTNGTTVNSDVISADELASLTAAAATGALATETTRVATVAEGDVNGALTITENTDGTTTVAAPVRNTKLDSLQSVGAISMTLLRHDLNNLTKRMGELRDAPKGVPVSTAPSSPKVTATSRARTTRSRSVLIPTLPRPAGRSAARSSTRTARLITPAVTVIWTLTALRPTAPGSARTACMST